MHDSNEASSVAAKLQSITQELVAVEQQLVAAEGVDPTVLSDFRGSVNRVRTTAWGVQCYMNDRSTERDPTDVLSLLAGERIRVLFQLAGAVEADLANPKIRLQPGQLLQLEQAMRDLLAKIKAATAR